MYKEVVEVKGIKCTIHYDEEINPPQVTDACFEFDIEEGESLENKDGILYGEKIADIFKIKSYLRIGDQISTSSSFVIIPLYKSSFELYYELSQRHLQNHIDTLCLVYHKELDRRNLISILKMQVEEFCNGLQ